MANFNDIGLSTDEVVWMAALQAILSSSLIMDPSSDSNIPTNSKRFELVGGVWELQNWNGSSWATIPLNAQRLQGNQASDIDYSAGDGIDISGSNVISVETATTGNRGGVLLATNADRTSTSRAATPAGVQDAIGDISLDNYTPGDGIDISGSNAISVELLQPETVVAFYLRQTLTEQALAERLRLRAFNLRLVRYRLIFFRPAFSMVLI